MFSYLCFLMQPFYLAYKVNGSNCCNVKSKNVLSVSDSDGKDGYFDSNVLEKHKAYRY